MPAPTARPLEKTLLSTRVYNRLRGDIISGRLAPGERLVEMRMASELEVSQGTVREAIKRLSAEGLVLSVPHRGSHVTTVDASEARHAYRIRAALDRIAAEDFCANATSADLDAMEAQIEAMRTAALVGFGDSMVTHDATFHRLMWERSGNPILARLWDLIEPSMRGLTQLSNRLYFADLADVADTHRPLLKALRDRDVELAADLFAGHAESIWHKIDAEVIALEPESE
jgi:DNA-binding GntR family transcriptional regulator